MVANIRQENTFGTTFLDDILEWIKVNIDPGEVFDKDQLEEWANDEGMTYPD